MNVTKNVSLSNYSTMRLGGIASYLCEIHTRSDLKEAVAWAKEQKLPILVIGGGSNVVWRDEGFSGLVIVNKIMGYETLSEDESGHCIAIGGGESWDSVVARSVADGLTGIEALSLIPGTAGATPIQNVGAYGQEISQSILSVEAYDLQTDELTTLQASDCQFGYRTSIFKTTQRGRYIVTTVTVRLTEGNPAPPYYTAVQNYFDEHPVSLVTPAVLRDAVIAIRSAKLPDVNEVANNGSFFANPIIDEGLLKQLQIEYSDMPHWDQEDGTYKIPAAWLLEQAGFKDIHDEETGMGTWSSQPLVLVNEHAKNTADLLRFKQTIIDAVRAKFYITLEQEPELLP